MFVINDKYLANIHVPVKWCVLMKNHLFYSKLVYASGTWYLITKYSYEFQSVLPGKKCILERHDKKQV